MITWFILAHELLSHVSTIANIGRRDPVTRLTLIRMTQLNDAQKYKLVEFMSKHPQLQTGKFTSSFTVKAAQSLWKEITTSLNSIPNGAVKEWRKWRKTWQDLKKNAKGKNAARKKYSTGTGGGETPKLLSDLDNEIIYLSRKQQSEGLGDIGKSHVTFSFEDQNIYETVEYIDENIYNEEQIVKTEIVEHTLETEIGDCGNSPQLEPEHSYNLKHPQSETPKTTAKSNTLQSPITLTQEHICQEETENDIIKSYHNEKMINCNFNLRRQLRNNRSTNAWWRHLKH